MIAATTLSTNRPGSPRDRLNQFGPQFNASNSTTGNRPCAPRRRARLVFPDPDVPTIAMRIERAPPANAGVAACRALAAGETSRPVIRRRAIATVNHNMDGLRDPR